MTLYVVTAVEFDPNGRAMIVEGAQVDALGALAEPPSEVPVEQVIFALERGDDVRAKMHDETDVRTCPRLRIKDGAPRDIELADTDSGLALTDIPRIARTR